jgi:glycosyltransferase involved in cell wall biosynthesis
MAHICFIGEFPHGDKPVGGISIFLRSMTKVLQEQNHQVTVISFSNSMEGLDPHSSFPLYRIHPQKWKYLNFLRIANLQNKIIKQVHELNPIDTIETPESGLCFLKKLHGIKYVIRLHGGHIFFAKQLDRPVKKWRAWQEIRSFKKADAIAGVSSFVLEKTSPFIPKTVFSTVIYNAINTSVFSPLIPESRQKDIVYIGWLVEKKGARQLLLAFLQLAPDYPEAVLHFYGSDTFDECGKSFQEKLVEIIPADIRRRIVFHGNVPNEYLPEIISKAYCCVYPSQMEAMPIAWLEVLAMGQLLIGGNTGPANEIIVHHLNGLLCDPFDPESIACQIKWAFNHPIIIENIRLEARKTAIEKFSAQTVLAMNLHFWFK